MKDFPDLKPIEIETNQATVGAICRAFSPPGATIQACSLLMFSAGICPIFVNAQTKNLVMPGDNATILEHEKAHCKGYEHAGSHEQAKALAVYKKWIEFLAAGNCLPPDNAMPATIHKVCAN